MMSELPVLSDGEQQLPDGWELTTLGQLANYINGRAFKPTDWETTGRPIIRIQNLTGSTDTVNRFSGEVEPKYIICDGDLLISWSATLGAFIYKGEEAVLNQHIFKVEPFVNKKFLYYLVKAYLDTLKRQVHGSGMQHITKGKFDSSPVPLPPLPEQKRIADKLDTLLTRVDSCERHLERVPQILKRFRQSVLAAATEGRLTGSDENDNAQHLPLSEVIERLKTGPFGSALHKADYISNGIPLVNPMHINDGRITPSNDMTISKQKAKELKEFLLTRGDIVLARRGVMGRCAVVGEKEDGWLCGSGSMLLHPTDKLLPEYLQIFLSSPETVSNLEADSVGSTMSNLNQKILLALIIRVPGLEEQAEIVRRVETLFAFAERLEARYATGHGLVEQLTPSLLAKAFRGELVEQDPNDEPASALVERIRETREAERASSTGKKPSRKKDRTAKARSQRLSAASRSKKTG